MCVYICGGFRWREYFKFLVYEWVLEFSLFFRRKIGYLGVYECFVNSVVLVL